MLVLDTPFRPNALLVMSIDVGSSDDDINALSVKGVTAESAAAFGSLSRHLVEQNLSSVSSYDYLIKFPRRKIMRQACSKQRCGHEE